MILRQSGLVAGGIFDLTLIITTLDGFVVVDNAGNVVRRN